MYLELKHPDQLRDDDIAYLVAPFAAVWEIQSARRGQCQIRGLDYWLRESTDNTGPWDSNFQERGWARLCHTVEQAGLLLIAQGKQPPLLAACRQVNAQWEIEKRVWPPDVRLRLTRRIDTLRQEKKDHEAFIAQHPRGETVLMLEPATGPGNRPMTLGPHAVGSAGSGKSTPAPDTTDWQSLSDDEYRQKVAALMPTAIHAGKPASATEQSWAALEAANSRKDKIDAHNKAGYCPSDKSETEPQHSMSAYAGSGVHPAKQFVEGLNTVGENAGSGLFYTAGTTMGLGEAEALKLAGLGGGVFDAGLAAGGAKLGPKYDVLGEMRSTPNKQKLTPTPPLKSASSGEKGQYGEARAKTYMQDEHPNLQKTGRDKGVFENGIDGVYKNKTPPPDYVLVEAKYNKASMGYTKDGKQMSDGWLTGKNTGFDRIGDAVGREEAAQVRKSLDTGKTEKWLLRVDEQGGVSKRLLDVSGNMIRS